MSPPAYTLVEEQSTLDQFVEHALEEPVIAVDTEAASFHRFVDRVYLLQFSTPRSTVLVDPLAVTNLEAVGVLLGREDVEKVFHDADYDLRVLDRDYGFHARSIFDTRIAAQLSGEPSIGLAALLDKYFGVQLSKAWQRADWSVRPLPVDMLVYAASDTAHLLALRDLLEERLESLGRLAWAKEEFALAEATRWQPPAKDEERYLRIKGAKKLDPQRRGVLRELHRWRESEATRLDRAEFRILSNENLLALANVQPRSPRSMESVRPLAKSQARRYGDALLAAIRKGQDTPAEPDLPKTESPAFRRDPMYRERVDRLRKARNAVAQALELDPGVLCGKPVLEAVARQVPTSRDELSKVPSLRAWQVEALGDALLSALC